MDARNGDRMALASCSGLFHDPTVARATLMPKSEMQALRQWRTSISPQTFGSPGVETAAASSDASTGLATALIKIGSLQMKRDFHKLKSQCSGLAPF
jgi:hypothetical protein